MENPVPSRKLGANSYMKNQIDAFITKGAIIDCANLGTEKMKILYAKNAISSPKVE